MTVVARSTTPLAGVIAKGAREPHILAVMRDMLLPMLISCESRLTDAAVCRQAIADEHATAGP